MDAIQKSLIINDFSPGWVLQQGTNALPNGLLELTNAFVEPDGSIISRNGIVRINSTQLSDGLGNTGVHSHVLSGNIRYIGVGSVIKRGMNPGTNIVSGLSGNRITFAQASPSPATSEQWTYFANGDGANHGASSGDCRKKDNGTTTRNWGIDGPSSAPTVALTTSIPTFVLIDSFAAPYTVFGTGTEGAALEPYAISARSFSVTSGNTCRFRRQIPTLNLNTIGDDGFIRLMIRLSRIADVQLLGLAFDVLDGTFTKDFYHISTRQVGFSVDNLWEELRILKGNFVRVKSSAGSTRGWSTVVAIQFVVSGMGGTTNPFIFSVDDMRLEQDTHAEGVFDYRMTWWNDSLKIRSNSRSLADVYAITDRTSNTINASHQGITVTRTTSTSDLQVTHWELWRRNRKGAGVFQFVNRILIASSTFLDTLTDDQLGEGLVDDNHIPPPGKFVIEFDECLFMFGLSPTLGPSGLGEEQSAYTVRYSARFRPESFPLTNYLLAGSPTDTIRGGCVWQNQLWIFTKKHVYRVEKLANGYIAQLTEAPLGTESPYSISPSPFGIFYYVPEYGPYLFNGTTAERVGTKIQLFFDGELIIKDGITIPVANANTVSEYTNIQGQYHNNTYTLVIEDSTSVFRTLVYNVDRQQWYRYTGSEFTFLRLSSERAGDNTNPAKNLEAGNINGWLIRLDPNHNQILDPGSSGITVSAQLTFDTILKPQDCEIDLKDIVVDLDTAGQLVAIQASFDDGALQSLSTQSAASRRKLFAFTPTTGEFPLPAEGQVAYKVSVRLVLTQSTARIKLYGIGINYWAEPRRTTNYTNVWHAPRQKGWARRGRIVMRSTAPVIMRLMFDDTGIAARFYEVVLPSTTGRRRSIFPTVPTGMEGKVARIVMTSAESFVLYPETYFSMGVFGEPAREIPWFFAVSQGNS